MLVEVDNAQNTFDPSSSLSSSSGTGTSLASGSYTTLNPNDMLLGLMMDEAGGTDTITGTSGYTTAISSQNFHSNTGAAVGVVYKVVSSAGSGQAASASITSGSPWVASGVAIEHS